MKFLGYILFFLFVKTGIAQPEFQDTTWFDAKWKYCEKSTAAYYRVYKKTTNGYLVYDKYLNGKTQMMSEASKITPDLIQEGYSVYYNEDGSRSSRGFNKNDDRVGIWTSYFDNEKDSSIYEYVKNEPVRYIRKSVLQKEEIFTVVEFMPEYPGGQSEMIKFLQSNITYPKNCNKLHLGGKAFLKFVVSTEGIIEDVIILKTSGFNELDEEALRVVRSMPKWTPGTQNGKTVPVYFNMPINFFIKTPFYMFNVANKSENYIKTKSMIESGDNPKDIIRVLKKDDDKDSNLDLMYNLGVAYFHAKEIKKSCECFNNIVSKSNEKITVVNNTKEFLQKYCAN